MGTRSRLNAQIDEFNRLHHGYDTSITALALVQSRDGTHLAIRANTECGISFEEVLGPDDSIASALGHQVH